MKTYTDSFERRRLEAIYHQECQSQPEAKSGILAKLDGIWQWLQEVFVGGSELRIWQAYDRNGNNWWHAYDPLTGRHASVESEAEMRAWIEQHYYR